jgi:membrane protein implicated in regulation of membrane protease activity
MFILRRVFLIIMFFLFFTPIIVAYSIGSNLLLAGFAAVAGLAILLLYTIYAIRKTRRPKPPQLKNPRVRKVKRIEVTQPESDVIDMHLNIDRAKKAIEKEKEKLRQRRKF